MKDKLSDRKSGRKVPVVDRRRVGREDSDIEATEPNLKPSYVEEMEDRVRLAEQKLRERIDQLESETLKSRERVNRDLELRFREREEGLLLDVLEILDDLERASSMASADPGVQDGLRVTGDRLRAFMKKHGCEAIDPRNLPFDPETMEALQMLPGKQNAVVQVLSPGIRRGDRLLRPSRVAVGKGEQG